MKITPNFHFAGQCNEALKLYTKAFNGEITVLLYYKDADERDFYVEQLSDKQKNYVYHSEMVIGEQRFMFSDSLEQFKQGQSISIVITFANPTAVRSAYDVLKKGGQIIHPLQQTTYSSCFVSLLDKFGIRWELMTENS